MTNCSTPEETVSFLATTAKRQKVEVKLSLLGSKDRQLFEQAKTKEVNSWLDTNTVSRILRNKIPRENILRCRWILTWKDSAKNTHLTNDTAVGNTNRTPKARLVVLGYEDPSLHLIQRDSPTLSKLGRSLLLQYAASCKWHIASFDVKTAFLRGTADGDRLLGQEPPEEMKES